MEKGNISYESFRSMTVDEFIDPLSFLKKIASLFELEIQYRTEVVGNHIERYVDMMKKRGQDTGKTIELEKDLIGIKRIENSQNICTALIGFVKGEGDNIITIEKLIMVFLILLILMLFNDGMKKVNINSVFIVQKLTMKTCLLNV